MRTLRPSIDEDSIPMELDRALMNFHNLIRHHEIINTKHDTTQSGEPQSLFYRDQVYENYGFYLNAEILKHVRNAIAHGKDVSLIPTRERFNTYYMYNINNGIAPYGKKEREFIFFWGAKSSNPDEITKACLSNHFEGYTFEETLGDETKVYKTVEQYMMEKKALHMGDWKSAEEIMQESDPVVNKRQGRKVKDFDEKKWEQVKVDVVKRGIFLKFSQNEPLRQFLLETDPKILVEASPYDRIWGIGLKADHEDAKDPKKWRGTNLLGFCLMDVRDLLIYGEELNAD